MPSTASSTTTDGVAFQARVRAFPEDGAANKALEELVARWLAVPKRSVSLVTGGKSRLKSLRIDGDPIGARQDVAGTIRRIFTVETNSKRERRGMSGAQIIDGKKIAADVRAEVAAEVARLMKEHGIKPGLAVVLVGENPASKVYVANKAKQTVEVGMNSWEHRLPAETSETDLLALVDKLNNDPACHGILVQLPLPKHINSEKVLNSLNPDKDVDGFHPVNVGRLWVGERALVPCTPTGSVILAKTARPSLSGLDAVVVGRSNIVGKPVAALLLRENCTVTVAHSRTKNIEDIVKCADLVVAAVGIPEMVKGSWIRPGATVIDVGINRVPSDNGKAKLVGDVAYEECAQVAGAITPVPGGVGPMTIACLLRNAALAAAMQAGVKSAFA
jgi:methylenetetrahydrofolate dehydrogenase (NADP+) / methenyltetrahydrofolate cyclohydrolase